MSDKITSFVIDRLTWIRGSIETALLTDKGKMCCLGFYSAACQVSNEALLHTADPHELDPASRKTLRNVGADWLFGEDEYCDRNSTATNELILCNDIRTATDEVREQNIARIFAENGVTVTFIN